MLFGGAGDDTIYAGGGDDLVFGDQGMVAVRERPLRSEISLPPICDDS